MSMMAFNGNMLGVQRRDSWSYEETCFLLRTLRDLHVGNILEGTRQKNALLFKGVQFKMQRAGFKKTWPQLRMRWKLLKAAYLKEKRDGFGVGAHTLGRYFDQVKLVLEGRPPSESLPMSSASSVLPTPPAGMIVPKLERTDDGNLLQEIVAYAENAPISGSEPYTENQNQSIPFGDNYARTTFSFAESTCVVEEESGNKGISSDPVYDVSDSDNQPQTQPTGTSTHPRQNEAGSSRQPVWKKTMQKNLMAQILSHQRQLHDSNQKWLSHQLEMQRNWQQQCLQQQLSVVRSTVQQVTTAFTNGMQQMLNAFLNVTTTVQQMKQTSFQSDGSSLQDDDSASSNLFDGHTQFR